MRTRQIDIDYKDLAIDRQEIYRTMGYGDGTPEPEILAMLDEVLAQTQRVCRPRILYRICNGQVLTPLHIEIGGVNFRPGKIITDSLAGAELFCLFVATAGREFEEFRRTYRESGDCVREFIADSVGSVLAEACVANSNSSWTAIWRYRTRSPTVRGTADGGLPNSICCSACFRTGPAASN